MVIRRTLSPSLERKKSRTMPPKNPLNALGMDIVGSAANENRGKKNLLRRVGPAKSFFVGGQACLFREFGSLGVDQDDVGLGGKLRARDAEGVLANLKVLHIYVELDE